MTTVQSRRGPPPNNTGKRIIKINALAQAQLIKLLLEGTYTCVELAEMTGLHYVTVLQYTRELHRAGAAYIDHWEKDGRGRDTVKVYKLGAGKDAKRQRLTEVQRQMRYRAKMQAARLLHVVAGQSSIAAISEGSGL